MARVPVPLNALRAFEASARHLSFTRAADELCVTQAAVSHQIKALEARLGVALFRRSNRGLLLTDEGMALAPTLVEILRGDRPPVRPVRQRRRGGGADGQCGRHLRSRGAA
ncbi:LysR family transcriptional regulator [Sphingomonas panni]